MDEKKGLQYEFCVRPKSREEAIVKGEKYRITVLTPSLLRMEYSESGRFEERATQAVIDRAFDVPPFTVKKEENRLVLETEELLLSYDGQPFSKNGLVIQVKKLQKAIWHYGQKLHDLGGTYRTLDRVNGNVDEADGKQIVLGHGVISREGFSVIDDNTSMALTKDGWVAPREKGTDLYFFGYGHRYLESLKDFYHLCGKTPLIPRYALGNWWSRYYRYTEKEYKQLMERFEREKIPFSVAVIDMDWHLVDDVDPKYGSGWTGYTWNRNFFPDPKGFLGWLHDRNLKVTLNVHPADGVRAYEELYPKVAEACGIDPKSEKTVEFDPADPVFMKIYFNVLCHELEKQGVDFWWIDWQQGETSKMPGLDPLWILNHYHYLDSSWKGTRPITFSRYAQVGSHRYPIGFSGDTIINWDSLDYQPYFTSTASNIGYGWWSHDIGGHMKGERNDELTARWVQFGVFSPINRLHSSNNPFSGKEPWKYGEQTRQVMNRYLRLRHAMVPYLYTMNRRAGREDLPLIQPMYYAEPECEACYQVPNEYYFGTELIAAPITKPADPVSRTAMTKAWLPKGRFADFFTGMIYQGGRMVDLWRSVDDMPVFMKEGAIVPMKDMAFYDNRTENPVHMEVRVFPAADGSFVMWEDDGNSVCDLDENWASTQFTVRAADKETNAAFTIGAARGNLDVIPKSRTWKVIFYGASEETVTVFAGEKQIEPSVSYDRERSLLSVTLPEIAVTEEIILTFPERLCCQESEITQYCYPILERAQMDYGVKEAVWNAVKEGKEKARAYLWEASLEKAVRESLLEVLNLEETQ